MITPSVPITFSGGCDCQACLDSRKDYKVKVYRPYIGEGLPKEAVWKREEGYIYFRCSKCSKINRNTGRTFATIRNPLIDPVRQKLEVKDIGVLYRCISCNRCRSSISGTVLLGFKNPKAFIKKSLG